MIGKSNNRAPLPTLTVDELEIFQKCADDILEFIKYIKIFNPNPGMGWLNLADVIYPKQKKILKDLQENWKKKYIVLLSPRQSSKTTLVMVFILWLITFTSSSNVGILANKKDNARKIFRRFSGMYERLPQMFRLATTTSDSKFELELEDGTIVFCAATSKSGLRSESLTLLYLDEFAWLPTPDIQSEFWTSNYPIMQSMDGGLIVSSTPNGKDLFYDLFVKTQKTLNGMDNPDYDPKWLLEKIHWRDVDPRGKGRDDKWKEQTIRDLAVGGKNGAERFAQEFDNSFEIKAGVARFFNQDVIARMQHYPPDFEWVPGPHYVGEPIKIYDQVGDQTFLVGIDISEGKTQNFSVAIGLSVRKQRIQGTTDLDTFAVKQAFQFMNAAVLPDDFFDLIFEFVITQLNDKWFMVFEINDVGRIFSVRFENLIGEIMSGEFSKKNALFKKLLMDKFSGDNELMVSYLTRRVYRSLGGAKKRGYVPWGLKSDRKNNIDLKSNLKTVIDKGIVSIIDEYLIEEMRLFEDRKGKENITHPKYDGVSHFDLITALKFSTWMLSDRDRVKDVLSITPLIDSGPSRDQQYLEAVLGANSARSPREAARKQMQRDNMEELKTDGEVPLKYNEVNATDMGDLTSMWNPFGRLWRKR
jgi:hypothetical protein